MIHIMVKMRKGEKEQMTERGMAVGKGAGTGQKGEEAHEGATSWKGGMEPTRFTDSQPIINPVES